MPFNFFKQSRKQNSSLWKCQCTVLLFCASFALAGRAFAEAPAVVWTNPPAGTYLPGQSITVSWTLANVSSTLMHLHYGTNPQPSTNYSFTSSSVSGPAGTYSLTFALPTVASPTTYYFTVHANTASGSIYSPVASAVVSPDLTPPAVAIEQDLSQSDPTPFSPINFTVTFSEAVSNFTAGKFVISGTAGATAVTISGSGPVYSAAVSGMTQSGTVSLSMNAGVVNDLAGNGNSASASLDNTVTYNMPATRIWTGGSADSDNWSDDANWDTGHPVVGDILIISGSARVTPFNDLQPGTEFQSLSFNSPNFTISGNGIGLHGTLTANANKSNLNIPLAFTIPAQIVAPASCAVTLSATVNNNGNTLTFKSSGQITVSNPISGSGGLVFDKVTTPGTLLLASQCTYTGGTNLLNGMFRMGADFAIPAASYVTVSSTSVLDLFGKGEAHPQEFAGLNVQGTVTNSGTNLATLTLNTAGTNTLQGGLVSGAISLKMNGTGTLIVNGTHTYTGETVVASGTLALRIASGLGNVTEPLTVLSGGTLRLETNAPITKPLALNGFGVAGTGALHCTSPNAAWTGPISLGSSAEIRCDAGLALQSSMSGPGSLTKSGEEILILNGDNTYTGQTTLVSGTLQINGLQSSSNVTVLGGTLTGQGKVGSAKIGSGGELMPGTLAVAALFRTADLTMDAGSALTMKVVESWSYDTIVSTGIVTLNGTFNMEWNTSLNLGQAITIIDNQSASPVIGAFTGMPEGATMIASGKLAQISYAGGDGNDVTLTIIPGFVSPISLFIPPGSMKTSSIFVSGFTRSIANVRATIYGLQDSVPDSLDILMVGPLGQTIILMSDAGGANPISNVTPIFDDSAVASLPDSAAIIGGFYKATDYEAGDIFPSPAPPGPPTGSDFSVFNETDPNGAWRLFVYAEPGGAQATFAGWSLLITTGTLGLSNIAATPPSINEGGSTTLSGQIEDENPGQAHTVTIDWADGSQPEIISLPIGTSTFSLAHQFLDDPAGAGGSFYGVHVSVTDGTVHYHTDVNVSVSNRPPTALTADLSAASISESDTLQVSGAFADVGTADTHIVSIDWGDGSPVSTQSLAAGLYSYSMSHVYADDNPTATAQDIFTVHIVVTDDDGGTVALDRTVTVANIPPLITALAASTVNEGETSTLTGAFVDSGLADQHQVIINWGDGSAQQTVTLPAAARTFNVTHKFVDDPAGVAPIQSFPITVTLRDDDTGAAASQTTAEVHNLPPGIQTAQVTPASINENQTVTLSGTVRDAGADVLTLIFDWGDGKVESKMLAAGVLTFSQTHRYLDDKFNGAPITTITVYLQDDDGGVSPEKTVVIAIANVAPTAGIQGLPPQNTAIEGTTVTLQSSVTDPGTLDTFTYNWTATAGANVISGHNPTFSFVVNGDATYAITLDVIDDDGGIGSATPRSILALNVRPTVTLIEVPLTGFEGTAISMFCDVEDPVDTEFEYAWFVSKNGVLFGTGGSSSFTFTPDDNGSYAVTLSVSDDSDTTSASQTIAVLNRPPTVSITNAPQNADEGSVLPLSCNVLDPGTLDTFACAWVAKLNGNTVETGTSRNFDFRLPLPGDYSITVTVTDKDGGSAADTVSVHADNVPPAVSIDGIPELALPGSLFSFTANVVDADEDTFTYAWSISRDGTVLSTGTDPQFSIVLGVPGGYDVDLTVTDAGGLSQSAHEAFTVVSGPLFASSLIATPNPSAPGETVVLTAPASGFGALQWFWDFGDGATQQSSGDTVSHVFTPVGTYTVRVTVTDGYGLTASGTLQMIVDPFGGRPRPLGAEVDSDGDGYSDALEAYLGSDPLNMGSTPLNLGIAHPEPLGIKTLSVKLNFAKPNDSISLAGTMSVSASVVVQNRDLVIEVGGIIRTFTFDSKGRSASKSGDAFALSVKPKSTTASYSMKLVKGTFQPPLEEFGYVNDNVSNVATALSVTIIWDRTVYRKIQPQVYTAKKGKSGASKIPKK